MKKKYILVLFALLVGKVYAQPKYTATPPSFTAEDEVTLTVDVSSTSLKNHTGDVWMWAWISEGCSENCGAPTNIDPAGEKANAAKMTRDANNSNIYSITFVPSAFFNKPPSQIKKFGFKLKSASWSEGKQSDTDVLINVDPLVFIRKVNRVFPTKVTKEDVVTLYLDQTVATNPNLKYAISDFTVTIVAYNGDNAEVAKLENKEAVNAGEGLHYVRLMPTHSFGKSDIASIKYRFKSKTSDVQSDEFSLVFFK